MFKICIFGLLALHFSFCQYSNNTGKPYYFRMSKNKNEFKMNNRVYYLNHNITDYDYTHKRIDNRPLQKEKFGDLNKNFDSTYYIDEEWNFDHKSLNKTELPLFLHKFYEKMSPDVKRPTKILFNTNRNTSNIIQFNLNSLKEDEIVIDAEFYFFWPLENNSDIYKQSVVLRLYQFEKQLQGVFNKSTLIENPDIHKLFNVIYISKAQKGWQIFKIKKPIDNWRNGENNLGLLLTISSYDDNKLISVFNDANEGVYRSFAVITVQNNATETDDGSVAVKEKEKTVPSCERKEWTVSFKKLQWDEFIIAPEGFRSYDCTGKCINSQADSVNHVKLLRIFHKRTACCVPVDYSPIPVMFYDRYGNVVIKNYENMIVAKCGCR